MTAPIRVIRPPTLAGTESGTQSSFGHAPISVIKRVSPNVTPAMAWYRTAPSVDRYGMEEREQIAPFLVVLDRVHEGVRLIVRGEDAQDRVVR